MQNHKNGGIQDLADNLLKELQKCEKIFKTRPCLEILAQSENRKSTVDDVNFKRITYEILKQKALMGRMEDKLLEMNKSIRMVKDLSDDMNIKCDIPK